MRVSLALRASANARELHAARKRQSTKLQKTVEAHGRSLTQVERKAAQQLAAARSSAAIAVARQPLWFEKFRWFLTSENFLVLSGARSLIRLRSRPAHSPAALCAAPHRCACRDRLPFEWCCAFVSCSAAGTDAQQMDILLKRFFRPGDVFVGCEMSRSLGCIIKNPKGAHPPCTQSAAATHSTPMPRSLEYSIAIAAFPGVESFGCRH